MRGASNIRMMQIGGGYPRATCAAQWMAPLAGYSPWAQGVLKIYCTSLGIAVLPLKLALRASNSFRIETQSFKAIHGHRSYVSALLRHKPGFDATLKATQGAWPVSSTGNCL